MRRKLGLLTAGAAAAALGAGGMALAAGGTSGAALHRWGSMAPHTGGIESEPAAPDVQGATTISLLEGIGNYATMVRVGHSSGVRVGDYVVFRDPLKDLTTGNRVGDVNAQCTFGYGMALCNGNAFLTGRGRLTFQGSAPPSNRPFTLAITGGTGEFQTARGQVHLTPQPHGAYRVDIAIAPS